MQQLSNTPTYTTLEEIQQRKEQLAAQLEQDSEKIGAMWTSLFTTKDSASKGEYISAIVANSVTAIDAFLLVRKLMKNYSNLFSFFKKTKKAVGKRK